MFQTNNQSGFEATQAAVAKDSENSTGFPPLSAIALVEGSRISEDLGPKPRDQKPAR